MSDAHKPLKYSILTLSLTHIRTSLFYVSVLPTQLPFRKNLDEIILPKLCTANKALVFPCILQIALGKRKFKSKESNY